MSDIKIDAENSKLRIYEDLNILILNPRDSIPDNLMHYITFEELFRRIEAGKCRDLAAHIVIGYATIAEDDFGIPTIWQAHVCNPKTVPSAIVEAARSILSTCSDTSVLKVHKYRHWQMFEGKRIDFVSLQLDRLSLTSSGYYAGSRAMTRSGDEGINWFDNPHKVPDIQKPLSNEALVPISEFQYLITKLASECSELSHAALKAIEFGIDNPYPDSGMTVREKMEAEYNDILGVVQMLSDKGFSLETKSYLISAKIDKVTKMMDVAREYNVLENN